MSFAALYAALGGDHTVQRRRWAAAATYDAGRPSRATPTDSTIQAIVTPAPAATVQALAPGARVDEFRRVQVAAGTLRVAVAGGLPGDEVLIDGDEYVLRDLAPWKGPIPHDAAIVQRRVAG